jgi:hypothetical protein
MLAPSIWYSAAGEMYLRDSFYALNGIHNRELNEKVFNLWADNQAQRRSDQHAGGTEALPTWSANPMTQPLCG